MSLRLKPYPAMKNSGLPWLGKVPDSWRILRGKNVFRVIDIRSQTGAEELLTVSAVYGVVPRRQTTVTMFKAESYVGHKLCWPGDLVINSLWAWMQGLGIARHHGLISSAYSVYRPQPAFAEYANYFHYALRSDAYKWELQTRSKGVWLSRLQLSDPAFLDMPVVLPPTEGVATIVRFLDQADKRIKRFIAAKRRLIELLNEQKQAIIQKAVTRGLDPNVRLKPSGIGFLGHIPEGWTVSRLKREASHIVDCLHATPEYVADGPYPAIRTADLEPGHLRLSQARRASVEQFVLWTSRLVPQEGDVLYSREGERYGMAALVPAGIELCVSQRMMVLRIRQPHSSEFVMWQLNCRHVRAQASADIIGATSPHVNVERIRNFELVFPPATEQRQITESISENCSNLNVQIDRAQCEIKLMREYRTRLIADVVTGKLDVRGVELPPLEEAEDLPAVGDEAMDEAPEEESELEPVEEGAETD